MPCPEKEWYYRDPNGEVHGPYTKTVMANWNRGGYFKADLPIRAGSVLPFVPLTALFPPAVLGPNTPAFDSTMIVPLQWLTFKQGPQA